MTTSATGTTGSPVSFASALRSVPFRRLVEAHAAGTVAQLVLTLAVGLEVLDRTGSGPWLSAAVALGFAPYVLFSGLAGVVADRWSRSRVLAWSSGLRAGCGGAVVAGSLSGWPVPVIVVLASIAAIAATPSYPALAAATPESVPDEQLPPANALVTGVENVSWIAGPGVLGLVLLLGLDVTAAMVVSTVLFGAGAVAAGSARLEAPPWSGRRGWGHEALAGVRVLRAEPGTRGPMALAMVDNFLYGYVVVALVLLATERGSTAAIGWSNAALTLGALGSLTVVNRLTGGPAPALVLAVVLLVFGGAVGLLGVAGPTAVGLCLVALGGAATVVAEVIAVTMLQRATPAEVVARLFGVYDQLNVGALALGSLLAGPLARWWGAGTSLVVVAGGCVLATLLLAPLLTGWRRHSGAGWFRGSQARTSTT